MRANDFTNESAVDELKNKLPSLKNTSYDTIDELMQKISRRYKLTGKKLHDLFVHKYGHTPDTWIKKIKNRLSEDQVDQQGVAEGLSEDVQGPDEVQQIKDFIKWSMKTLNVKTKPKFTLSKNTEKAQDGHHTGMHSGDRIWVYIANRNLIDIFRTIFHELVHQRQYELNMIKQGDSYPGSPIEAMADMIAGKYIKIYGKEHPEIVQ